ncbi:hypothetical protein L0657_27625 [Dyadobacter sp. CY345]|uniref:hypothetical protein n=1 Tax=Dyadobacter sp. CY345 TaxID=2909335 RepID=UPI001F3C1052|nr:hypothetical protein [Dyadobacter sp. CY345]MCF2447756.1 hypothetical protein [Dyadobacter sp. CY345]
MTHEKTFSLAVDREAKIVIKGTAVKNNRQVSIDFEFLIKEKHDKFFRAPIGLNHPKYWKLQSLTPEKSQLLQLVYSGLSKKHLDESVKEFKQFFGAGYVFSDAINVAKKVKTLRGIRLTDMSRRILMAG